MRANFGEINSEATIGQDLLNCEVILVASLLVRSLVQKKAIRLTFLPGPRSFTNRHWTVKQPEPVARPGRLVHSPVPGNAKRASGKQCQIMLSPRRITVVCESQPDRP